MGVFKKNDRKMMSSISFALENVIKGFADRTTFIQSTTTL